MGWISLGCRRDTHASRVLRQRQGVDEGNLMNPLGEIGVIILGSSRWLLDKGDPSNIMQACAVRQITLIQLG